MGSKETQRVAGFNNQSLFVGHYFQIFFDETVLHPVLANLTGLAVGNQLVWIESYVEVQVVVDHNLASFTFDAVAFVFVDWFAVERALWTEAVTVDTAGFFQLFSKFFCHLFVMVRVDVTQSVFDRQNFICFAQVRFTFWSAAQTFHASWVLRKLIVQLDGHSIMNVEIHKFVLLEDDLSEN